eukprot:scaffold1490_cov162-Ochromonas_danica.AAC.38
MSKYSSSSGAHDDEDDNDDDDEGFSGEEEEEEGKASAPMMSLFASYYGIEASAPSEVSARGTIDDHNFNADEYCRSILQNEMVEGLVAKDANLVHEIRNLDGEMQKLVYDNYNKFITATETIKEMKTDVFAMDNDMNSLRDKMKVVALTSCELDGIFEVKRQQVDKLVRVRRLLDRLDFLSELPEKLAVMIDSKLYKDAVELYNKSISVLTRHSHVLSFKNIKERTEQMMADLTSKVIDLMGDVSLEAVKVGPANSAARFEALFQRHSLLSTAPREKVLSKLLDAHRNRSLKMIDQFSKGQAVAIARFEDLPAQLSAARQFHQSLVVGLIEACRGVRALHCDRSDHDEMKSSFKALSAMIDAVMGDYQKSFVRAFERFFAFFDMVPISVDFDHSDLSDPSFDEDLSAIEVIVDTARGSGHFSSPNDAERKEDSSVNRFAVEEERNSWLLLARQSILDVMYLDSTQSECLPTHKHGHSSAAKQMRSHAKGFADVLLAQLYANNRTLQEKIIDSYIKSVIQWLPKIEVLGDWKHFSVDDSSTENNSQGLHLDISRSIGIAKKIVTLLTNQALQSFSEMARYVKPVADILVAIQEDCQELESRLCDNFVEALGHRLLAAVSIKVSEEAYESRMALEDNKDEEEDVNEIFALPTYEKDGGEGSTTMVCILELLFAGILRKLSPLLTNSMTEELDRQGFPSDAKVSLAQKQGEFSQKIGWLTKMFTNTFLESNRVIVTKKVEIAQSHLYAASSQAPSSHTTDGNIDYSTITIELNDEMIEIAKFLDSFTLYCILIFMEPLPSSKNVNVDRDLLRRAAMRHSVVSAGQGQISGLANQSLTLQLDMDRLFSRRVRVFERLKADATVDALVGSMLKAVFKTMIESLRTMTLSVNDYLQLQAQVAFLKQDVQTVMGLMDQVLSVAFSRYTGANDLAAASDVSEVGVITKAVGAGFQVLANETVLMGRSK